MLHSATSSSLSMPGLYRPDRPIAFNFKRYPHLVSWMVKLTGMPAPTTRRMVSFQATWRFFLKTIHGIFWQLSCFQALRSIFKYFYPLQNMVIRRWGCGMNLWWCVLSWIILIEMFRVCLFALQLLELFFFKLLLLFFSSKRLIIALNDTFSFFRIKRLKKT